MSELDVVTLSRVQFALTVGYHFIFVPLTIGMALFVAIMETIYVKTNNPLFKSAAKFWGKLFVVNFVLGVVTGLTMEFQFGTNWSNYSIFMGDIFGSPLAFEALMAFFLESTFMGLWIWGWKKLSPKMHAFTAWMVALGVHLSAIWIIVANSFMQGPTGYQLVNGRAEMVNFLAVLFNPYAWHMYPHVILGCYAVSSFMVLGVAAWHLMRNQHVELMKESIKKGIIFALIGTIGLAITGDLNGKMVYNVQPSKFAAMEAIWETKAGVGFPIIAIPNEAAESTTELITIPGLTSFLATWDANATITGLKDIDPADRPPVALTFWSFRIMILLGVYMIVLALAAWWFNRKGVLQQKQGLLKAMVYSIPVPYVAIFFGWCTAEIGRQPWTVYGLIRTADSVSPIPALDVLLSLGVIIVLYTTLVVLDIYYLRVTAIKGPEVEEAAAAAAVGD